MIKHVSLQLGYKLEFFTDICEGSVKPPLQQNCSPYPSLWLHSLVFGFDFDQVQSLGLSERSVSVAYVCNHVPLTCTGAGLCPAEHLVLTGFVFLSG